MDAGNWLDVLHGLSTPELHLLQDAPLFPRAVDLGEGGDGGGVDTAARGDAETRKEWLVGIKLTLYKNFFRNC